MWAICTASYSHGTEANCYSLILALFCVKYKGEAIARRLAVGVVHIHLFDTLVAQCTPDWIPDPVLGK